MLPILIKIGSIDCCSQTRKEIQPDGKQENLALKDVAILWLKRVKVGLKICQNSSVNLSSSLAAQLFFPRAH